MLLDGSVDERDCRAAGRGHDGVSPFNVPRCFFSVRSPCLSRYFNAVARTQHISPFNVLKKKEKKRKKAQTLLQVQ